MNINTVKGFDKNLKCRDFQYEIGKEYEIDKKPVRCTENGFHSCENPIDVLSYYPPNESKYCNSEASGEIDKSTESSSEIKNNDEHISKNAVAIAIGCDSMARASINNWLILDEWDKKIENILRIKTVKVDGKKIKANTFYKLINGKFKEVK